ncbi:hypothetical protein C8R47DRAFT_987495 [Mycena vitilis]|nr:hypothetical protein C8R47DRAFT_987495 [Mycena vitilis]
MLLKSASALTRKFRSISAAVVRALLKDGTFSPRAITRNRQSEAALNLRAEGAEVVKGDPSDRATLNITLRGSELVFGERHYSPSCPTLKGEGPNELVQGISMVDAAKEAGVKVFIFTYELSTSLIKLSGGKYRNALHFEQKAAVEEHLRASGLANATLHLGSFLGNFWTHPPDTTWRFRTSALPHFRPDDPMTYTWVERDVTVVVLALLKNFTDPSKGICGSVYPVVTALIPHAELVAQTAQVLGVEVTFTTAPPMGGPAFEEMFVSHIERGLYPDTPVLNPALLALGPELGTIQEFLATEVKPRFEKK